MASSWLQTSLAVYFPLNKPHLLSESHLARHHLISPRSRICQMESSSQATLICLIFKQQWTSHETKIAVGSQVWLTEQRGDQEHMDSSTWGSCSKWLPQVAPSQLLATSGCHSMQGHAAFPHQLGSATHHFLLLNPLWLCILAISTDILTLLAVGETKWTQRTDRPAQNGQVKEWNVSFFLPWFIYLQNTSFFISKNSFQIWL